ncbi:acyltransferase [bacterium]|nr:acyltransferase [bacterium]
MQPKNNSRKQEVDSLKAVAVVGVLVAHMSFEERFDQTTTAAIGLLQGLFGWCVIAFFFASGLLVKKPISNSFGVFFASVLKRGKRLLIPCITFSIMYRLLFCGLFISGRFSFQNPIPSGFWSVTRFLFVPIGPQFYFLPYLFAIGTVVAFFQYAVPTSVFFSLFATIVSVSYIFVEAPELGYGPSLSLLPIYLFSYVLGFYLSSTEIDSPKYTLIFLAIPLLSMVITSFSFVAFYLLVPVLLRYAFRQFPTISELVDKTKLGKYSGSIYVWHAPIVLPFTSIVCVKLIGGQPMVIPAVMILTLFICILLGHTTSKFSALRFLRF